MKPLHPIDPDDPRLTAYALGELDGAEAAEVAAAVEADPALRAAVEEIRATGGRLTEAFAAEPAPAPVRPLHFEAYHPVRPARLFRLPYWSVAAMAMAACVAVVMILRRLPWPAPQTAAPAATLAQQTGNGNPTGRAAPGPGPAAQQTRNLFEIQFPKKEEIAAAAKSSGLPRETLEHIGVVVPNVPGASEKAASAVNAAPAKSSGGSAARGAGPTVASLAPSPAAPAAPSTPAAKTPPAMNSALGAATGGYAVNSFAAQSSPGANPPVAATAGGATPAMPVRTHESLASLAGSRIRGPEAGLQTGRPWDATGLRRWDRGPTSRFNTESYDYVGESGFRSAAENPLSTFSVDVDTASYSNVRRFLRTGRLPPPDAVRIEELLNYFTYRYAPPPPSDPNPLAASLEVASAPWAPDHRLVRIGLKARELPAADRGRANLVFLVDVSGSMDEPDKLPLVKEAMRTLVRGLRPGDHVAIVTYAGTSGLALPSTTAGHRREILDAIDGLHANGSTNGGDGIQLAYDVAKAHFIKNGVNRVILATDGDFNVGITDRGDLVRLIEKEAKTGVFLTALGVGTGNYKDATLEQLADRGNGTYAYLDSAREARRVLAEQVNGTLTTVAKDVKVQVEFNPARVQAYRLIGYADRRLAKEDFNNDKMDAGDIGAGEGVTALYEVIPTGVAWKPESTVDALKYRRPEAEGWASEAESQRSGDRGQRTEGGETADELLTVKVRYKAPAGDTSKRLEFPLVDHGESFAHASVDFKFAAAVAGFGMVLRDSQYKGKATIDRVKHWAEEGIGSDPGGTRGEFISLVKEAGKLLPEQG